MSSKEECRKQRKESLIWKTEQQKLPSLNNGDTNEQNRRICGMIPICIIKYQEESRKWAKMKRTCRNNGYKFSKLGKINLLIQEVSELQTE